MIITKTMEIEIHKKAKKGIGRTAILAMLIAAAGFVSVMSMPLLTLGATPPCITFESNPPIYSGSCSLATGGAISRAVTMPGVLST